MNDIVKMVKSVEKSSFSMKFVSETFENEAK